MSDSKLGVSIDKIGTNAIGVGVSGNGHTIAQNIVFVMKDNLYSTGLGALWPNIDQAIHLRKERDLANSSNMVHFQSVKDFWKAYGDRSLISPGKWVSVKGTFSEFAPLSFGTPEDKKKDHFNWRGKLTTKEELRLSIDAIMSFSSGNATIRLKPISLDKESRSTNRYAGLYQGVGRNSIPLVIDEQIYVQSKKHHKIFSRHTFEAEIVGTIEEPPNMLSTVTTLPERENLPQYVLQVAGANARINYLGPPTFLEADAWGIFEADGTEIMVSRCPDFADEDIGSIAMANEEILEQVKERFFHFKLKQQYDYVDKPLGDGSPQSSEMGLQRALDFIKLIRDIYAMK